MASFSEEYNLWQEFLDECLELSKLDKMKWVPVILPCHHTQNYQTELLDELFIQYAPLSSIVNRKLICR